MQKPVATVHLHFTPPIPIAFAGSTIITRFVQNSVSSVHPLLTLPNPYAFAGSTFITSFVQNPMSTVQSMLKPRRSAQSPSDLAASSLAGPSYPHPPSSFLSPSMRGSAGAAASSAGAGSSNPSGSQGGGTSYASQGYQTLSFGHGAGSSQSQMLGQGQGVEQGQGQGQGQGAGVMGAMAAFSVTRTPSNLTERRSLDERVTGRRSDAPGEQLCVRGWVGGWAEQQVCDML